MPDVRIIDLPPYSGAGIGVYSRWPDVKPTIQKAFGRLYAPGALAPGHGHNFILYSNETRDGGALTVGVLDREPGGADPDVKPVQVPGGRVITATHWGDYANMKATYDALHAEVNKKSLKRIWMSLEIYGDMYDDPAKVRTDFYLYLAMAM